MKINISNRNFNPSDNLINNIERKMERLSKYFSKDTTANVMLSNEKGSRQKLEATIRAGGMIFRAEEVNSDIYYCLDKVIDKLSSQMSRFKGKLLRKGKDQKEVVYSMLPDAPDAVEDISVVKTKRFRLNPMTTEEAIMQMELLEHSFFVFADGETGNTNVVYKRADGTYGLLVTE
ncbi:MAG: ribosome-associated translation inhibitor RaiA [Firmicutes bacterium]|nr:ribosome-associated translation inhibitor RaiA [Bacillota bacterium]